MSSRGLQTNWGVTTGSRAAWRVGKDASKSLILSIIYRFFDYKENINIVDYNLFYHTLIALIISSQIDIIFIKVEDRFVWHLMLGGERNYANPT